MRFARLARKFEELQFGHRFLSNWMNCLGVTVQSVLKDFYLEDSNRNRCVTVKQITNTQQFYCSIKNAHFRTFELDLHERTDRPQNGQSLS